MKILAAMVGALAVGILLSFLMAVVVMIGWNLFAPAVGLATIGYWPAFGLSLVLAATKGSSSSS